MMLMGLLRGADERKKRKTMCIARVLGPAQHLVSEAIFRLSIGDGALILMQRALIWCTRRVSRLNHKRTLFPARKDLIRESSNREVTDKPKSAGHFTHSASVANIAGTMLSIEIVQATKRGSTRQSVTRGQQVPFESSANHNAHEVDECSDEPQSVHVPHLRAIDKKAPFACDATVDPKAQSVPQAVHSEESLRVQNVSKDLANMHRGQFGSQHADQSRTHLLWECDQA